MQNRTDEQLAVILAKIFDEIDNPIDYRDVEHTETYRAWKKKQIPLEVDVLLDLKIVYGGIEEKRKNVSKATEKFYKDEMEALHYLLFKAAKLI